MLLLHTKSAFKLVDITGEVCTTFPTDREFTAIAGNPHSDDYFFTAVDTENQLHGFRFMVQWIRKPKNSTEDFKRFNCTIVQEEPLEA